MSKRRGSGRDATLDVTWRCWLKFAQFSCVLLCAYVVAYYATVCPAPRFLDLWGRPKNIAFSGPGPWHSYRIGGHVLPYAAYQFFRPIHVIDRKLRPETWWTPED
jgi:hypothetical protein